MLFIRTCNACLFESGDVGCQPFCFCFFSYIYIYIYIYMGSLFGLELSGIFFNVGYVLVLCYASQVVPKSVSCSH
jgi:hypothetical protein